MADITPTAPERLLKTQLPDENVDPEQHEHTYHVTPPVLGSTNMSQRPQAIQALLAADSKLSSV